jgi:2-polyprenyl-3-methyl-5-hydroxy-6-metoxy-1,4-benzoquinol methylase
VPGAAEAGKIAAGKGSANDPLFCDKSLFIKEEEIPAHSWGLVVLDLFRTGKKELVRWAALAPVVGIDEGDCRDEFDFLIDLLPGPQKRSPPNLLCPAFLPRPENSRPSFYGERGLPFRILVSFGAEDPAGLTVPAALALAKEAGTACEVTALFGPLNKSPAESRTALSEAGVRVVSGSGDNTRELFSVYDLLVTQFGLGAFEALAAKVPVVLVSPGSYHEALAKNAGFVSAGTGKHGLRRLGPLLFTKGLPDEQKLRRIAETSRAAAVRWLDTAIPGFEKPQIAQAEEPPGDLSRVKAQQIPDLGRFLLSWSPVVHRRCPACGGERRRLLERFPDRSYRRCLDCGIVFMDRTGPPPQRYDTSYFFEDYEKQYGKTYLEDFPALKKNGKRRLGIIQKLLSKNPQKPAGASSSGVSPLRLLDVGCAYGPFLEAAGEEGFVPDGIDPAEDAVRYVREKFKFKAFHGGFPEDFPGPDDFIRSTHKASGGDVIHSTHKASGDDVIRSAHKTLDGDIIRSSYNASGSDSICNAYNVVTFWFVIEHFDDPGAALAAANRLLVPGGVLAFSTPSFCGISRRKSRRAFLEKSPGDHWTVWDPGTCARLLSRYGFTPRKTVITGHHPERFPLAGRFLKPGGTAYRFFHILSRVFGLGDTFEVYAVKTGELSAENHHG